MCVLRCGQLTLGSVDSAESTSFVACSGGGDSRAGGREGGRTDKLYL